MKSKRLKGTIPLDWYAEIQAYIEKNEIDVMCDADYVLAAIAEKLNKSERSRGLPETHVYKPADVRVGRPRTKKKETTNASIHEEEAIEATDSISTTNG